MKYSSMLLVLSILSCKLTAAPRPSINNCNCPTPQLKIYRNQPMVQEPLPDDVRDQQLLVQGMNVVAQVGKILLNPEDIPQVKQNASALLQGIVNFVQTMVRRPMTRSRRRQLTDMLIQLYQRVKRQTASIA